mmetsp:Transcript_10112/g.19792  ORF Transcript_10112/g.19792 Transcript_10112/m.19792 type:complete len:2068 (+) Transcript_10112:36-6239(+)
MVLTRLLAVLGVIGSAINATPSQGGGLKRFLENLEFEIKDIPSINGSHLYITYSADLNPVKCKNITISDISSNLTSDGTTISVRTSGLGIMCWLPDVRIRVKVPFQHATVHNGTGSILVYGSSLEDTVKISGENGLAVNATNTLCNAGLKISAQIHMRGLLPGLLDIILQLFKGTINRALSDAICNELTTLVNSKFTSALQAFDNDLEKFLPPNCCTPLPPPASPRGLIDWNDTAIGPLSNALNSLVGVGGLLSINKIFDLVFGGGSKTIDADISKTFRVDEVGNSTVTVSIENVILEGLDRFEQFEALEIASPHVLQSKMKMEKLNISAALKVAVSPGNESVTGSNLTEKFQLKFNLVNPNLQISTYIGMFQNWTQLQVGQLGHLPCVARSIFGIEFLDLALNFTVGKLEIIADSGGLEGELDELIDNVLNLFVMQYTTVVPGIINGVLGKFIRPLVNDKLRNILETSSSNKCEASEGIKGDLLNWENYNRISKIADFILNFSPALKWVLNSLYDGGILRFPEVFRFDPGNVTFIGRNMTLSGFDTVHLQPFDPVDNETFKSALRMAGQGLLRCDHHSPLNLTLFFDYGYEELGLKTERIEVDVSCIAIKMTNALLVNGTQFLSLPIAYLRRYNCLLTSVVLDRFEILDLDVDTVALHLTGKDVTWKHPVSKIVPNSEPYVIESLNRMLQSVILAAPSRCQELDEGVFMESSSATSPLESWIQGLQLNYDLPGITGNYLQSLQYRVDLNELRCDTFDIAHIRSSLESNSVLSLSAENLRINCSLADIRIKTEGAQVLAVAGMLFIQRASVNSSLELIEENGRPKQFISLGCGTQVDLKFHLELSGHHTSTALINLLTEIFQDYIDARINSLSCNLISNLINDDLTSIVENLNKTVITPFTPPVCCPLPSPIEIPEGMVRWNESAPMGLFDDIANGLIGADGPLNINKLYERITGGGLLHLHVNKTMSFPLASLGGAKIQLIIGNIDIDGIDSFTELQVIQPTSAYVMTTEAELEYLKLSINMTITVNPGSQVITGGCLTEKFVVEIGLNRPFVSTSTLVALAKNTTLSLGQISQLPCVAESLSSASITDAKLNYSSFTVELKTSEGDLEEELDEAINNVVNLLLTSYETLIPEVIDGVIRTNLLPRLNKAVENSLTAARSKPCNQSGFKKDNYFNFTKSTPVFDAISDVLAPDAVLSINWIIDQLINGSEIRIPSTFFTTSTEWSGVGEVGVTLSDLVFSGVDTFSRFDLVDPLSSRQFQTAIKWADGGDWLEQQGYHIGNLSFFIDYHVAQGGNISVYHDIFKMEIDIANLTLTGMDTMMLNVNKIVTMPISRFTRASCLLSAVDENNLDQLELNFGNLLLDVTGGRTLFLHKVENVLRNPHTDLVNRALELFQPLILKFVNKFINKKVYTAPYTCDGLNPPNSNRSSSLQLDVWMIFAICAGGIALISISASLILYRSQNYRTKLEPSSNPMRERLVIETGDERKGGEPNFENQRDESSHAFAWECLANHHKIPMLVKYFVPCVLLFNIGVFISSNTSIGASVNAKIQFVDYEFNTPSIFDFTLQNTIQDMWDAGVYPLSILVAVFSGGWTYLKLLLMMAAWIFPLAWLKPERRETLLIALDALGKWSLIDTYILCLMLVAFHFDIEPNTKTEFGVQLAAIHVLVNPGIGFYTFLLATILSLATTNVVLHFHRTVVSPTNIAGTGSKEALCNHDYIIQLPPISPGSSPTYHRARCTKFGKVFISLLIFLSAALILAGSIIESFKFEFKGLTGWILQDDAVRPFSILSVIHAIPHSTNDPNSVGVRWIQATFYVIAVVVPLLHLVVMLALWWIPMRTKPQYRVFYFTEILNAWSALDVMVISLIAAILEIQQFAKFLVGDKCDQINALIEEFYHEKFQPYDTCFDVIATLSSGCWALFAASIVSIIVAQTVMRSCHIAMHSRLSADRLSRSGSKKHFDEKSSGGSKSADDAQQHIVKGTHCFTRFLERLKFLHLVPENSFGRLKTSVGIESDEEPQQPYVHGIVDYDTDEKSALHHKGQAKEGMENVDDAVGEASVSGSRDAQTI